MLELTSLRTDYRVTPEGNLWEQDVPFLAINASLRIKSNNILPNPSPQGRGNCTTLSLEGKGEGVIQGSWLDSLRMGIDIHVITSYKTNKRYSCFFRNLHRQISGSSLACDDWDVPLQTSGDDI